MDNNVVNTINSLLEGHLDDYQIEKVNEVIRDFQDINEAAQTIAFSVCPKCGKINPVITKAGRANGGKGKQMYRCHSCNKRFVFDHGQLTYYSHQSQAKWNTVIEDAVARVGMRKTAKKINVSEPTAFRMRHKLLHALESATEDASIGNVTEADEKYIPISHCGTKMPHLKGKKRGKPTSERGLNDENVCIMTCSQRDANSFAESYNMGKPSAADASKLLRHVENGSVCYTDKINIYDKPLDIKNCCHKKIKLEDYNKVDNLNMVNSFHTMIQQAIARYRNVASKYINRYNALFTLLKSMTGMPLKEKVIRIIGLLRKKPDYFYVRQILREDLFKPAVDKLREMDRVAAIEEAIATGDIFENGLAF